jgi:hypothetical protein
MFDDDYRRHVPPHLRAAMDRLRDPQAVWNIFRDDTTVADMERLTARKRPAVGAASVKLLALGSWVRDNDAKKTFGKLARFIKETIGYTVDLRGVETPEDPLFSKGTRYRMRPLLPVESVVVPVPDKPQSLDLQEPMLDRLLRALNRSELQHLADRAQVELARR